jgi:hypothetical protein
VSPISDALQIEDIDDDVACDDEFSRWRSSAEVTSG